MRRESCSTARRASSASDDRATGMRKSYLRPWSSWAIRATGRAQGRGHRRMLLRACPRAWVGPQKQIRGKHATLAKLQARMASASSKARNTIIPDPPMATNSFPGSGPPRPMPSRNRIPKCGDAKACGEVNEPIPAAVGACELQPEELTALRRGKREGREELALLQPLQGFLSDREGDGEHHRHGEARQNLAGESCAHRRGLARVLRGLAKMGIGVEARRWTIPARRFRGNEDVAGRSSLEPLPCAVCRPWSPGGSSVLDSRPVRISALTCTSGDLLDDLKLARPRALLPFCAPRFARARGGRRATRFVWSGPGRSVEGFPG